MIIFSAILVFASITIYRMSSNTLLLNKIFIQGFGRSHFFSLFEITFIIMAFLLLVKFRVKKESHSNISKIVFFLIVLTFILKMLNPNNDSNNPILGMPFFSDISNFTFILLAFFSLFLDEKSYMIFLRKLFYYIGIILTIRVLYLFLLFGIRKGYCGFGVNSSSGESDLLFLIAFYQIAFFVLYLICKNKKYLVLWLVYLLFQIFSYRRSALAVALFANVLSYILILLKGKGLRTKLILIAGIILIYGVINNFEKFNLPYKYERYVLRFVSAIPGMALEEKGEFSDSGHWEQTSETFYSAFKNLGFWGTGYGNIAELEGASKGYHIHNVYAATWAQHGLFMLIFYIIIIIIVLYNTLKIFLFKYYNSDRYYIVKISIGCFLLMWFGVLVTNPLAMAETFKMEVFWFTLFTILIKVKPEDEIFLLGTIKDK